MCGIVGALYGQEEAAPDIYTGLLCLQHRGKDNTQIVTSDGSEFFRAGGKGEAAQVFGKIDSLLPLQGHIGVGQTRYGTTGSTDNPANWQPIEGFFEGKKFFVVHNGNIVNLNPDNASCEIAGASDTVRFVKKLSLSKKSSFVDAVIDTVEELEGSFCLIIMHDGILYAVRDKFGFHPLVLGRKNCGFVVASESCALDMIGAEFVCDIEPGSFYRIGIRGFERKIWAKDRRKIDIFEFIYFSRPDSIFHGVEVGRARQEAGKILAQEHPAKSQLVISMPNSANEAALGYFNELRKNDPEIEFNPWALFRSHFVGRTFLEALSKDRKLLQKQKFNPRWPSFVGIKELVVVDDSLIRGTVMAGLRMLFNHINKQLVFHGFSPVEKIHIRVASPPYFHPDYYGVDTYRRGERLIANDFKHSLDKIADHFGFASLKYLSLEGLTAGILNAQEILGSDYFKSDSFYTGPFTGIYPDGIGCYG